MKKLLFDLTKVQPVDGSKFHGGGKYGLVVFKKLVEKDSSKIAAFYDESRYIDPSILDLCKEKNIPTVLKSEMCVTDAAKMFGGVLYSPLNDSAYLKDPEVHAIVTIHGLRVLEMPYDEYEGLYKKANVSFFKRFFWGTKLFRMMLKVKRQKEYLNNLTYYRNLLNNENYTFVTVSEHSKNSILSFVPKLGADSIKVFYSPTTIDEHASNENCKNPYGSYFLIVSGDRWLKNAARAIEALDELFSERPQIQENVVITGLKSIDNLSVKIKNKHKFIAVDYVDETCLKSLYQKAKMLIYPSLNEGFGYPPLEAMHEHCPVIASAIASIPEVCGDAVIYFNPYSKAEIKMRILQMMDETVRTQYIEKGTCRQKLIEKKQKEDLDELAQYLMSFV